MDTVPPFIPPSETEEKIYGRGACDAKGIIAAQITAAEQLRKEGIEDIGLLYTVEEERASTGAKAVNLHPLAVKCEYLINGEPTDNDLAIGFGRILREIQLGKVRREALRDMSDRMGVPDVTSFTAAVIQADQLGVSMTKILRVQSDQMRVKRRQRAQEKAHQAPVKMMIPMVLLIFPSLWIVLMGPAIIFLLDSGVLGSF